MLQNSTHAQDAMMSPFIVLKNTLEGGRMLSASNQ
jgi:hypothetical protein